MLLLIGSWLSCRLVEMWLVQTRLKLRFKVRSVMKVKTAFKYQTLHIHHSARWRSQTKHSFWWRGTVTLSENTSPIQILLSGRSSPPWRLMFNSEIQRKKKKTRPQSGKVQPGPDPASLSHLGMLLTCLKVLCLPAALPWTPWQTITKSAAVPLACHSQSSPHSRQTTVHVQTEVTWGQDAEKSDFFFFCTSRPSAHCKERQKV